VAGLCSGAHAYETAVQTVRKQSPPRAAQPAREAGSGRGLAKASTSTRAQTAHVATSRGSSK
jgi:hypothetical protein